MKKVDYLSIDDLKNVFWDNKILQWEKDKYDLKKTGFGGFFNPNRSVQLRRDLAYKNLGSCSKGKTVLELGCGTARSMEFLLKTGVKKYIGVDISAKAIQVARERQNGLIPEERERVELICADASKMEWGKVDILFSLGFLDWNREDEIVKILSHFPSDSFFHSFSRRTPSLEQLIHRAYVYFMYGRWSKGYRPQYYTEEKMTNMIFKATSRIPQFYKTRNLSFGSFVLHWPVRFFGS